MRKANVGILGSTGAVGREMLKVMEEKNLPIGQLRLFASSRSAGKVMKFHDRQIIIEIADEHSFDGLDVVLGAVDALGEIGIPLKFFGIDIIEEEIHLVSILLILFKNDSHFHIFHHFFCTASWS